ncbi:MAG: hypothetical protein KatS3mg008_1619 [Acidimicrobiales bacterium]|nr:MAG: hypothetical protein KatS3mg008_1619 [Acidimicrobiales bacterium]
MQMQRINRYRNFLVGGAAGVGILAGSLVLSAVSPVDLVGAQSSSESSSTTTVPADQFGDSASRRREGILSEALDQLVREGTLTREQADAVLARVRELAGQRWAEKAADNPAVQKAAEVIGVSVDDLVAALRDGKTIAQIASEKGVDSQKVVDALVAQVKERVDRAVEDGKIDSQQAEKILERAQERIQRWVEEGGPFFGHSHHPRHHRGAFGFGFRKWGRLGSESSGGGSDAPAEEGGS